MTRNDETREDDRALKEDVRWLSSALGDVIRRFEGQEVFEAVEYLRIARVKSHRSKILARMARPVS